MCQSCSLSSIMSIGEAGRAHQLTVENLNSKVRHPSNPFSWLVGALSHVLKDVVMALLNAEAL